MYAFAQQRGTGSIQRGLDARRVPAFTYGDHMQHGTVLLHEQVDARSVAELLGMDPLAQSSRRGRRAGALP